MTFEEFKDSAQNPSYPENKCIYCLEVITVKKPLKEVFEEANFQVIVSKSFLYLDKEEAEMKVKMLGSLNSYNTPVFAMYLYELPINLDIANHQFQRVWVYDRFGCFLSQSFATEVIDNIDHPSAKFRGRDSESMRFKPGEIVDVYVRRHDYISRGIVVKSPPTIEQCWKKHKHVEKEFTAEGITTEDDSENYYLHAIDDCYKVLLYDRFISLETPRSWDVFPLSYPVGERLRDSLYQKFHEYVSENGKKEDEGNCTFQELMDIL